MRICYLDESGCTGMLPSADSPIQPVFVPTGLVIDHSRLLEVTLGFLEIKKRFFPVPGSEVRHYLDLVLLEIKGADIRRQACSASRRRRTHALGFLDRLVDLLEESDARIIGRVWVKGIGVPLGGRALYTSSVQAICGYFQNLLATTGEEGIIIADSRSKPQNAIVSHSVFTQKFAARGDRYRRIAEMPTYGHSENHVGLQLADLLCSALLFPLAAYSYCTGYVSSLHVRPGFVVLKERYGARLKRLQYRYRDSSGKSRGGITVCDGLAQRPGGLLFG